MNLEDYPHYFLYVLVIYMLTAAFGFNFFFQALHYGILDGSEGVLLSAVVLLPVLFLALYGLRSKSYILHKNRRILRYISIAAMLISALFTAVIIIPLSF